MAEKKDTLEKIEKAVSKTAKKVVEKVEKIAEEIVDEVEKVVGKEKKTEDKFEEKKAVTKKVEKSKKTKLEELKKKAKALEGKVQETKDIDIKKKIKAQDNVKENALVPIENYLKSSIHLGTRVITPDMRKYVYKRRADGLAVFNTAMLDDEIRAGAEYLAKFAPENMIVICKREAGWKAVKLFAETIGAKTFTKKYPAGVLTNPNLDDFIETDLIFICDPWIDKNALTDANRIRIPVLSICDTNNYTRGVAKIIPGNNKSAKSLGMILYLLTKIYVEKRKLKVRIPEIEEFIDDWENLVPPK